MTGILQNKLFISTRPEGKSEALRLLLQNHGARLLDMPMIDIRPVTLSRDEQERLQGNYQWIIFTSANGIHHFFEQLKNLTGEVSIHGTKIAVIGEKTGEALIKYGFFADYVSAGKTATDFAKELKILFTSHAPCVLLPVGNLAGTVIEESLRDVTVIHRLNIYQTVMPDNFEDSIFQKVAEGDYEMIIFTSPSGFINFYHAAGNKWDIRSLKAACIGVTTAKTLAGYGVQPMVVSEVKGPEGLVNAIIEYYTEKNSDKN